MALFTWALFFTVPQTETEALPEISRVIGDIQIWNSQERRVIPLSQPTRVDPKDRIGIDKKLSGRIAVDSKLVITLKDVEADDKQGLSIERQGAKFVLRLYRGSLAVESCETEVAVQTPHVTVEGNAAAFLVEINSRETRAVALEGKLTMSNSAGAIELPAGEWSSAKENQAPAKPRPADPARDLGWVTALEGPQNIIKNPGFEEGLKYWDFLTYQKKPIVAADDSEKRSGKQSAKVHIPNIRMGLDTDGKTELPLQQNMTKVLKPGTRYFVRLWVRSEGLTEDGKAADVRILVSYQYPGSGKERFSGTCPPCEGKWVCARFFFTAEGEDLRFSLVYLKHHAVQSGTAWFDDVFVCPVEAGK